MSGVLTGLGGAEQIVLWQRLPGAHWRRAGQATTNSAGGYLITLANGKVKTNRDWYVAGDGLNSPMLREGVAAVVTLAVSPTTHLIHGAVTPSHAGEHVLFQLLRHDRWVTLAQPLLGQRSHFRVGSLHPSVSRGTVRAVFLGDARNIRSVSPVLTADFARS